MSRKPENLGLMIALDVTDSSVVSANRMIFDKARKSLGTAYGHARDIQEVGGASKESLRSCKLGITNLKKARALFRHVVHSGSIDQGLIYAFVTRYNAIMAVFLSMQPETKAVQP